MHFLKQKNIRVDLDTEANQIPAESRSDKARKARISLLSWIIASIVAIFIGIIIGYFILASDHIHESQNITNITAVKFSSDFQKRDEDLKNGLTIRRYGLNTGKASTWASQQGTRIKFHGGQIMSAPIKVHVLMYGSFTGTSLLKSFLSDLQESNWWGLTKKYQNPKTGEYAGTSISLGNIIYRDALYPRLSDARVGTMLKRNFPNASSNDIHILLTDRTVSTYSGFCDNYCGWHTNDNDFKYIYVGSPLRCQDTSQCSALTPSTAPNGDFEMDSMISIIAHELTEAVTDPVGNGWYFDNNEENADACNWGFSGSAVSNGKLFNQVVGSKKYLIQDNWDVISQKCSY